MKTHYYVILARPQGSQAWTPLTIHPTHNGAGNFFASTENAKQWVDHEMPESMQTAFLPGPKKRVLREFKIGRVVTDE
jgi:nicotinamidase-related amidase